MSFEFQSTLVNVTPNFRISGAQIGGLRILQNGDIKVARLIVTNDRDIQFALSGPYEAGDPDGIYAALSSDLYELVPGILVNEGAISSVEMTSEKIIIDLEGADLKYSFEPDAAATGPVELNSHSYKLSTAGFAGLSTAAATWRSSMDGTLEGLSTAITTEIADRIAAITAEEQRVDALIASGMWLFATQADFPAAADNHGRVVHSHADGAIFYAHAGAWHQVAKEVDLQSTIASLASEAATREAADTTLQGNIDAEAASRIADDTAEANTRAGADAALSARLDTLEADPTTATAVAAGDAATLSSANTYTDTEIATEASARTSADASLSGRLDVLEADPTTQTLLDAETTARTGADTALDGRVTALEGNAAITDPTTATALAALSSDVDQNEADSDSADAALSGRLDVLEADPTTQTEVDTKLDASAVSVYGLTLVDDADAATARTTLGLGTAATTASSDYATAAQGALADTAVQPAAISNIDNTSDADKPVSTATQAALDLRALLDGSNIPGPYANDAAAQTAGVAVGAIYKHDNGQIHYRVS